MERTFNKLIFYSFIFVLFIASTILAVKLHDIFFTVLSVAIYVFGTINFILSEKEYHCLHVMFWPLTKIFRNLAPQDNQSYF